MSDRRFDVFFGYNSKDREAVMSVFKALRRRKRQLKIFLDQEFLGPGDVWQPVLEEVLLSCRAAVVFLGPNGAGRWQSFEIQVAIDRQTRDQNFLLIPVLLPGVEAPEALSARYTFLDLRAGIDNRKAIGALAARLTLSDLEAEEQTRRLSLADRPYRGLSAFRVEDAPFFFGQEEDLDRLEEAVDSQNVVALVGPSGSGKSSLVQAGLIPSLKRDAEQRWHVVVLRPSDRPLHALASAFVPLIEPLRSLDSLETIALWSDRLSGDFSLRDLVDRVLDDQDASARMLLVIDQWEELYTQCRVEEQRRRFLMQVFEAVQKSRVTLVATVRTDFVGRALEDGVPQSAIVQMGTMDRERLRDAIVEPGRKIGLVFSDLLVEQMLNEVDDERSPLPPLEFTLTELWERWRHNESPDAAYIALEGVHGAIAARADRALKDSKVDEQLAQGLFLSLVHVSQGAEDVRRRVPLREIGSEAQGLVQPLVDAHLLVTDIDPGTGYTTVELAHESLVQHWKKLRDWMQQQRTFLLWHERLRDSLDQWKRNERASGYLLRSAPLAVAEAWLVARRRNLSDDEISFVERSSAEHQRGLEEEFFAQQQLARKDVRQKRRQLILLGGFTAFVLVVAIFGIWRWRLSLSRALAAEAVEEENQPFDLRLLLSLQAGKIADSLAARGSLLTLLGQSKELQRFLPGQHGAISHVAFSPDGRHFAIAGSGEIYLWDAQDGRRLGAPFQGHQGRVLGLAFSTNGLFLISCGEDKTMRFWRVADRQPWRPPLAFDAPVRNPLFSPDGKLIAASLKGSILLWDYPTLIPHKPIAAHKGSVFGLAFRKDGLLASSGGDGAIRLWRVDQPGSIRELPVPGQQVMSLAFSPDGTLLASAGSDQLVRLWDPETGAQLGDPSKSHRDLVLSLAFSTDGKKLASAGRDKVIYLWNVKAGGWDQSNWKPSKALLGHGATVWSLAFGAFGKDEYLVSAGDEPSAILWNLSALPRLAKAVGGIAGEVDSTALSRTGDLLAVGGADGTIRLWDTASERVREPALRRHEGPVNALVLYEKTLISGGEDGRILVWNLDDPARAPTSLTDAGPAFPVQSLALSRDGKSLAVGDDQGRVRLWEIGSARFIGEMKKRSRGRVYSLAFHPEGRLLASGDGDGIIRLWDVKSRKKAPKALLGHEDTITGLAFDPQGRMLASSSADRTVRLWDFKDRQQLPGSPLTGAESALLGVAFDAPGERIAASGQDGKILIWEVGRRYLIGSGLQADGSALNVAFHPDGESLVAGTEKGALLFDLRDETWRARACQMVGRNLTQEERDKYLPYAFTWDACPEENVGKNASTLLNKIWRGR
jgi:WD40 repeat protein